MMRELRDLKGEKNEEAEKLRKQLEDSMKMKLKAAHPALMSNRRSPKQEQPMKIRKDQSGSKDKIDPNVIFTDPQIGRIEEIVDRRVSMGMDSIQGQLDKLKEISEKSTSRSRKHQESKSSRREGPNMDLHHAAERRFKENQETDKMQPSKMIIKRVSVDRDTRQFQEVREDYLGNVRKYVKEMKESQRKIKKHFTTHRRGSQQNEISIKGFATGSDFYPHGGLNAGGGLGVNHDNMNLI